MTVELAGAFWVLPLAAALLALSGLLIVYRLLRGPSRPDRAVAIDALTLLAVAATALSALFSAQAALVDVAVLLALVSFLGTAAFAFLFRDAPEQKPHDKEPQ
ncbi:monovalent cation/H+ antiporter complex subunit F [Pseudomonas sp. EA_105y_Pfl2_R69]|jgi:multicomponent Na+:H+ antiporter subunit F|uniref:monovalent cation/H+ antiporter complex subunit F n=1 Tax=Pseudomonas sp. EA_105y_Pfl2_R69 TaxID=3088683 RepID=UPI0030D8EACD